MRDEGQNYRELKTYVQYKLTRITITKRN